MNFYQTSNSIRIKASPQRVYEALTHWKERMIWRKGLVLQWEGEDQAVVSQKISAKVKGFPEHSFQFQITGLEKPNRIFIEYTGRPLKGRAAVEIIPEGDHSYISFYWMKIIPVGFMCWLYFKLGMGLRAHHQKMHESLTLLKDYLEHQGGTADKPV